MKRIMIATTCAGLVGVATMACAGQTTNAPPAQATATATRATAQPPVPPPHSNPELDRILHAMGEASTNGHPDLFGQFAGLQRLFKGEYAGAMKYFKLGARYADKLSQLSIGMMYLNGRGVRKDSATACAWITLAAERGYPTYINARDHICAALSPTEHDRAMATLHTLQPEYGDKVAKQRMKLALRAGRSAVTGSLLGHDAGLTVMALPNTPFKCSGYQLNIGGVEVPQDGCGAYNPKLWNPKKYFAARDAQWFGTVTVGELHKVNPPISDHDKKKTDGQ